MILSISFGQKKNWRQSQVYQQGITKWIVIYTPPEISCSNQKNDSREWFGEISSQEFLGRKSWMKGRIYNMILSGQASKHLWKTMYGCLGWEPMTTWTDRCHCGRTPTWPPILAWALESKHFPGKGMRLTEVMRNRNKRIPPLIFY